MYGTEKIADLDPKIWNLLSEKNIEIDLLSIFKEKIVNWESYEYHCWLCKTYIQHLGFI